MNLEYESRIYENLSKLKEDFPEIAEEMITMYGTGEWVNEELEMFPSLEDFAVYEIQEGWYSTSVGAFDFRGAPDPLNYINLTAFGEALEASWDDNMNVNIDGYVIRTSVGW